MKDNNSPFIPQRTLRRSGYHNKIQFTFCSVVLILFCTLGSTRRRSTEQGETEFLGEIKGNILGTLQDGCNDFHQADTWQQLLQDFRRCSRHEESSQPSGLVLCSICISTKETHSGRAERWAAANQYKREELTVCAQMHSWALHWVIWRERLNDGDALTLCSLIKEERHH